MPSTTVLTLALDDASQPHFESLRQRHYPAVLNRIPAHVSLFHQLPATDAVSTALRRHAAQVHAFPVRVTGVRSLGKGVAFTMAAPELAQLQAALALEFADELIPQDRQRYSPHIVIQNKVQPEQAKELLHSLQRSFEPQEVTATGLLWWEYLGGPWRLLESFDFVAPRS